MEGNDCSTKQKEEVLLSMERALADVEMLCAAYPDEVTRDDQYAIDAAANDDGDACFLKFTLKFSDHAKCQLQIMWKENYPVSTNVQIASYRCSSSPFEKSCMEAAISALRTTAQECLEHGVEGCFSCASAAFQAWHDAQQESPPFDESSLLEAQHEPSSSPQLSAESSKKQGSAMSQHCFDWYTGEPVVVQKSTFVGHVCHIDSAAQVPSALEQLISGNSKLQRATHNMSAYRVQEANGIWKSDNDEDGEHGAGKQLSHLLEMRNENQVLVVVSRWFGGILLGPRRFAYITNCARNSLEEYHQQQQQHGRRGQHPSTTAK